MHHSIPTLVTLLVFAISTSPPTASSILPVGRQPQSECAGCEPGIKHGFDLGTNPQYAIRVMNLGGSAPGFCDPTHSCSPGFGCSVDITVQIKSTRAGDSVRSGTQCADGPTGVVTAGQITDLSTPCGDTDTTSEVSAEIHSVGCGNGDALVSKVYVWPHCTPCTQDPF